MQINHATLVFCDNVLGSHLGITTDLYAGVKMLLAQQGRVLDYDAVSVQGSPITSIAGLQAVFEKSIADIDSTDVVMIPAIYGSVGAALEREEKLIPWLIKQYEQGAILIAHGTAVFFLAETGLLDGKSTTVFWQYYDEFEKRYPKVQLDRKRFITSQDRIYCSNGLGSGMDLGIYLVEKFWGQAIAVDMEKLLFVGFRRGYENELIDLQGQHYHGDEQILSIQQWMEVNFSQAIDLASIAQRVNMSVSSLKRRFKAATGETPLRYLQLVAVRPRILRGLKKPPRPIYAWPGPLLLSILVSALFVAVWPYPPVILIYAVSMSIFIPGLWICSTRLAIAPGVLTYAKTGQRLREILRSCWQNSAVVDAMKNLGIDVEQFAQKRMYEDKAQGIRIEIRDKRTLEGAMEFLTSSEEIGNCIALRNFVAWCLPSLLNDETIMLCDVSVKGKSQYQQRAQLWLIASERSGDPVLTINSIEFNNEGTKYIDMLMPKMVEVMQDVCQRAGFKGIYVGISNFGRDWFDNHYPQSNVTDPIVKVHHDALGHAYYFDAFRLKGTLGSKRYEFMKKRTMFLRAYALIFGMLEKAKGNDDKAKAFFDSAKNNNNFWQVPVSGDA